MKLTSKVIQFPEFSKVRLSGDSAEQVVLAGGHVVEAYAKINAESAFSSKSSGGSGLSGSIHTEITKSGKNPECAVGPSVVYGRIQELGGWVKPVIAKTLHFVIDGVEIFAKAVYLPPRPYLRPAADDHMGEIRDAMADQIKQTTGAK